MKIRHVEETDISEALAEVRVVLSAILAYNVLLLGEKKKKIKEDGFILVTNTKNYSMNVFKMLINYWRRVLGSNVRAT